MPISKKTVTVTMSWYSSNPVFREALVAVEEELENPQILTEQGAEKLKALLVLNNGKPFTGETQYGPHTTICFEAPSLGQAVLLARGIETLLAKKFPGGMGDGTGEVYIRFAGKPLTELLDELHATIGNAYNDLKLTRRLLPSKNIQKLRTSFQMIHS